MMNPQFEGEFARPKRPGDLLIQWRNKQLSAHEPVDRHWHKYKFMNEVEASNFMKDCAPNSNFFEYRVFREA